MKKLNISVIVLTLMIVFGLAGRFTSIEAKAAYNVKKNASTVKAGTWKQDYKGYRFQYKTGKYYKNSWKKINGKIYYFDKKGYMATGWILYKKSYYYLSEAGGSTNGALLTGWRTLAGKKYYMSKTTGAMFTGWHTIGNNRYYFDKSQKNLGAMVKNKWVDDYRLGSNGIMLKDCYVKNGDCYVDKNGKKIAQTPPANDTVVTTPGNVGSSGSSAAQYNSYIFVGDSRTVGMQAAVGGSEKYIAKVGEGYSWLTAKALPALKSELKKNPKVNVVMNLGVNDCGGTTVTDYINTYKKLIADYPDTRFYIISLNPIEDKKAAKHGLYARNKYVTAFNKSMKNAFTDIYIDTYSDLKLNGFETADGLHYSEKTYQRIYQMVLEFVKG